ncbi:hypothetical protein ASV23_12885 [Enterobacter hormaechei subsp. steigerwaltii]|nr:hypothetical protein ASV23_12885 [Enterobacter hormaechei subsp. steigerwaltii]
MCDVRAQLKHSIVRAICHGYAPEWSGVEWSGVEWSGVAALKPDQQISDNKNQPQSGPLRLPVSAAVRSSSPTPPGRPLRTRQAPPNPCGFRAIRLGSDGKGQGLRLLRPCRPERLHRAG